MGQAAHGVDQQRHALDHRQAADVHDVEDATRSRSLLRREARVGRQREQRQLLLGHALLDERFQSMRGGDVDAVDAIVLGEVPPEQARRPGALERMARQRLAVQAHDASQVRVGRHQQRRVHLLAPGPPQLGERLPVEGDQVLSRRRPRGGPQVERDVVHPRTPRRREAVAGARAAARPSAASRAGPGRTAAGASEPQMHVVCEPRRSSASHDLSQMTPETADAERRRAGHDDSPVGQRLLLSALALGSPGGVERGATGGLSQCRHSPTGRRGRDRGTRSAPRPRA